MAKNKFKIGDWVCDKGDQSLGGKVLEVKDEKLLIEAPGIESTRKITVHAVRMEIWLPKNRKKFEKRNKHDLAFLTH